MTNVQFRRQLVRFFTWCESTDAVSAEWIATFIRHSARRSEERDAVREQVDLGVPASVTSIIEKKTQPLARHVGEVFEDVMDKSAFRTSAGFAATAIYQRGRLSVGSYLVLTEPFRVAGFDFEDGWGVGPDAEGVVTGAGAAGVEREVTDEGEG